MKTIQLIIKVYKSEIHSIPLISLMSTSKPNSWPVSVTAVLLCMNDNTDKDYRIYFMKHRYLAILTYNKQATLFDMKKVYL